MKGKIKFAAAYARGKMLDHSGLSAWLPRGISPSDIDMTLDNAGRILFIELSSKTASWERISTGQRMLYEAIVKNSAKQRAILAHVETKPMMEIDTDADVIAFSIMSCHHSGGVRTSKVFPGELWVPYLKRFYGLKG